MKKYITILSAALLLVSCIEKAPVREPSPIADDSMNSVLFSSSNESAFVIDPEKVKSIEVLLELENPSETDVTATVRLKDDCDGIFYLVNDVVTFPAGEQEVPVTVTFDETKVESLVDYSFTLEVDPSQYHPYKILEGSPFLTANVKFEAWEFVGNGTMNYNLYGFLYSNPGADVSDYEMQLYKLKGSQLYELRSWAFYPLYYALYGSKYPEEVVIGALMDSTEETIRFTIEEGEDRDLVQFTSFNIDWYDDENRITAFFPSDYSASYAPYNANSYIAHTQQGQTVVLMSALVGVKGLGTFGMLPFYFYLEPGIDLPVAE